MAAYVTYERAQRAPLGLIGLAGIALLGIAACSKLGLGGEDQMNWARAALERNDRLEVVAADPQTNTFTVRLKDSGELRMIRADQLIGGPAGSVAPPPATATPASSQSSQAPSPGASLPTVATAPANSSPPFPGEAATSSGNGVSRDRPSATTSPRMMRQASNGATTAAAADASSARTGVQPDSATPAEAPNPGSDVVSVTPGGRVLEAGPGYAIKAASKAAPVTARVERERSSTTSAAIERRHDPIVCQGDRLLHIDNRNLEFDGDAVSAEDGCEIHITNSHISAKGVGISAHAANVHIDNSQIEGGVASIDASDGAQVYAASSRFKGMSRRVNNSSFHDLGGNVWN
ncbi:MAG: hypothetical protein ACRETD_02865 [Steroidobacteraceae bacterium]